MHCVKSFNSAISAVARGQGWKLRSHCLERRKWPGAQSLQPPNTSRIRAGTWHACGTFSDEFGSYSSVSVRGVCVVVRSPELSLLLKHGVFIGHESSRKYTAGLGLDPRGSGLLLFMFIRPQPVWELNGYMYRVSWVEAS